VNELNITIDTGRRGERSTQDDGGEKTKNNNNIKVPGNNNIIEMKKEKCKKLHD